MDLFFIGWHQPCNGPSGCAAFPAAMISVNRLIGRRSGFPVKDWILDSGAFTRIASGKGHLSTKRYAKEIIRWAGNGRLLAAVSQDFMCEPFILAKTGLTVEDHQRLTIHRYDRLLQELAALATQEARCLQSAFSDVYDDFNVDEKTLDEYMEEEASHPYLMPVLQGFTPSEYISHVQQYGDRLKPWQWVGVGSVCKRNSRPSAIESVLMAIKAVRPDLRLHGFGLKLTALKSSVVWDLLHSADSLAPSYHARKNPQEGRSSNDPLAALEYAQRIIAPSQLSIFSGAPV
jgi:hypothetical protein